MPVQAVRGCPPRVLSGAMLKDERQSVHGGVLEAVGLTLTERHETLKRQQQPCKSRCGTLGKQKGPPPK